MIKDKTDQREKPRDVPERPAVSLPEEVQQNALAEMYLAVRRALQTIREREDDLRSPPFFKTIAIDNGQFARIVLDENMESEVIFPAVFIHYTNVRYLVQQQRIGEGRATMRVRFILNTLNNADPERECDPFYVFQRVNQAIQDAKNREPALNERCVGGARYLVLPPCTTHGDAPQHDTEGHGHHPHPTDREAIRIETSVETSDSQQSEKERV